MKSLIIIFLILVNIPFLSAQSVVIDINKSGVGQPAGYYRKDMNNLLNQFEGTYISTHGNKVFKIALVKKIKQYNGSYYEDLIIGEYQYVDGNLYLQDTMSNLNITYNNQYVKHAIAGSFVIGNNNRRWKCPQCEPNEKRLSAKITDVGKGRTADFLMRRTVVNGQQVLQVKIFDVLPDFEDSNAPDFSLPMGEFTMFKQ